MKPPMKRLLLADGGEPRVVIRIPQDAHQTLVFAAEDDPVVVFRLYAGYAAGRQDRVVDLDESAVCSWQDEIMQHVRAARRKHAANSHRANMAGDDADDPGRN